MIENGLLKIYFIGSYGVGKTTTTTLVLGEERMRAIGRSGLSEHFCSKETPFDDQVFILQIWEPGCLDRFKMLPPGIERQTQAIVLMYDISNLKTFIDLTEVWLS